jgi:hypothetical protein
MEQPKGWVRIADRLPDEGRLVLVCGDSGYSTHRVFFEAAFYDSSWHPKSSNHWYDVQNNPLNDRGLEPTHWARLPPVPGELATEK